MTQYIVLFRDGPVRFIGSVAAIGPESEATRFDSMTEAALAHAQTGLIDYPASETEIKPVFSQS